MPSGLSIRSQNPEFFFSYNARLKLRDQIVYFNLLVDYQVSGRWATLRRPLACLTAGVCEVYNEFQVA